MKTLKIYIKESIFDDVEDIVNHDTILIDQFLKDNYIIEGSYTIKDNVVDVKGYITVKNTYRNPSKVFFHRVIKTGNCWSWMMVPGIGVCRS